MPQCQRNGATNPMITSLAATFLVTSSRFHRNMANSCQIEGCRAHRLLLGTRILPSSRLVHGLDAGFTLRDGNFDTSRGCCGRLRLSVASGCHGIGNLAPKTPDMLQCAQLAERNLLVEKPVHDFPAAGCLAVDHCLAAARCVSQSQSSVFKSALSFSGLLVFSARLCLRIDRGSAACAFHRNSIMHTGPSDDFRALECFLAIPIIWEKSFFGRALARLQSLR